MQLPGVNAEYRAVVPILGSVGWGEVKGFFLKRIMLFLAQVFNDAIAALRTSYRKMNPFCVPFATTNMGSAMLAMDLVRFS